MNVNAVRKSVVGGYPVLTLIIDGEKSVLGLDQKRNILDRYGAIFLGPAFENRTQFLLPADPEAGQPAAILKGYTDDKAIVGLYRDWIAEVEGSTPA